MTEMHQNIEKKSPTKFDYSSLRVSNNHNMRKINTSAFNLNNIQVNINNFKEIQELGSGQHGSVVKVICSLNNQTFALKKILQSYFINPNTNQLDEEKEN